MAVHVGYNSWYISLPSSKKQQREMTMTVNGLDLYSELNTLFIFSFESFN